MIQIRKGMFETNSSSVHALIISKEQTQGPYHTLYISHGRWGWERAKYSSPNKKISYLCQAIYDSFWKGSHAEITDERKKAIDDFLSTLREMGIECIIDENYFDDFDKKASWAWALEEEGYVDHADTITKRYRRRDDGEYDFEYNGRGTILNELSRNKDMLLRYIYGNSVIVTTNDNCDVTVEDVYGHIDEDKFDVLTKYN